MQSQAAFKNAPRKQFDEDRFSAGFKSGWQDAADPSIVDKSGKMMERAIEYNERNGPDTGDAFEKG